MPVASWLALISLGVKFLVWADNQRVLAEGGKVADDKANVEAQARIKAALAARLVIPPVGVHDPDRRD
jgi:hypothetical protein